MDGWMDFYGPVGQGRMAAANVNGNSRGIGRSLSVFQAHQPNPTNSEWKWGTFVLLFGQWDLDNSELVHFYHDARSPQCRESASTAPSLKCEKPLTAELQGREALGILKINK